MGHDGLRVDRRRFLTLGVTAALVATGCSRWGRDDHSGAVGQRPADEASRTPDAAESDGAAGPGDTDADEPSADLDDAHREPADPEGGTRDTEADGSSDPADDAPQIDPELADAQPQEWGERVTGVRTRLATDEPKVALTFDACGGGAGDGYDAALIEHLRDAAVPATLFLNARWIEANRTIARDLARDGRFELANHGTEHRPISVTGREAYGIAGTTSASGVVDEVMGCQRLLTDLTGTAPRHFRAGTAYGDEVAVAVVRQLGLEVVNFDVLGDAGATFSAAEVERALLDCRPGSIALLHMNAPGGGTAAGVAAAIGRLRERGLTFTTLGDHDLT